MSPKAKTPIGGVPIMEEATSGEMDAVPATLDEIEASAAISNLPVPVTAAEVPETIRAIISAVKDINRRLREGNRKHAAFRDKFDKQEARLAALENTLVPRLTPQRAGKIAAWAIGGMLIVGGWLVTLDRMASRSDLDDLKTAIHKLEVEIAKLPSKGATP